MNNGTPNACNETSQGSIVEQRLNLAREIAARIWCDPELSHAEMDAEIALEIAEKIERVLARAEPIGFTKHLERFLNAQNREIRSNTPDYQLAEFVNAVLTAAEVLIVSRDHWYGLAPAPGAGDRVLSYEAQGRRDEMRVGAIIRIGKRLWRLVGLPEKQQGDDGWRFEYTEQSDGSCDQRRVFTRSELRFLVAHGCLVGQPTDGPSAEL